MCACILPQTRQLKLQKKMIEAHGKDSSPPSQIENPNVSMAVRILRPTPLDSHFFSDSAWDVATSWHIFQSRWTWQCWRGVLLQPLYRSRVVDHWKLRYDGHALRSQQEQMRWQLKILLAWLLCTDSCKHYTLMGMPSNLFTFRSVASCQVSYNCIALEEDIQQCISPLIYLPFCWPETILTAC